MKNFTKTAMGKTLLFLLCTCSLLVTLASATVSFVFVSGIFDVYSLDEKQFTQELIDRYVSENADAYVTNYVNGWHMPQLLETVYPSMEYRLVDEKQKVLEESEHAKQVKRWTDSYTFAYEQGSDFVQVFLWTGAVKNDAYTYVTLQLAKPDGLPETDSPMWWLVWGVHTLFEIKHSIYFILLGAMLCSILSFVQLMSVSGRVADANDVVEGPLYRIPFDILSVFGLGICLLSVLMIDMPTRPRGRLLMLGLSIGITIPIVLGLCMSAATRVKLHRFLKGFATVQLILWACHLFCVVMSCIVRIIKNVVKSILETVQNVGLVRKTALFMGGLLFLCALNLMLFMEYPGNGLLIYLVLAAVTFVMVIRIAVQLNVLQESGRKLAQGDLSYVMDTSKLIWDFKEHGENLNQIAIGMNRAVEQRMKSERMKTELITNVSHDIKTPLTSIINYATLLSQQPIENETTQEYVEVLVRQSERLKRLIEDLVEASKASSGNLDVNLAPCDASIFVIQAEGEYEQKMKDADLTWISKLPEEELCIMADGRRMWRVFDNIINNICKYAQPHTRVYISLEKVNGNAVFTFKNTSRDALDMSEEELMERFSRGDHSRHTEGNGLGLSIARSMTELQQGTLRLQIDGDLFKAILTFPIIA